MGVEPHCDPWHQFILGLSHLAFTSGPSGLPASCPEIIQIFSQAAFIISKVPERRGVSSSYFRLDGYESPQGLWVVVPCQLCSCYFQYSHKQAEFYWVKTWLLSYGVWFPIKDSLYTSNVSLASYVSDPSFFICKMMKMSIFLVFFFK